VYFSDLGVIALILALGFAVYTVIASVLGALRSSLQLVVSAKRSALAVFAFLILASAALIVSFLTHDFGVNYVAQHSSRAMPWYYVTAAFYGGQEGSLLYWALMLALFTTIFVVTSRRAPAPLVPYVLATLMVIETFFCIVLTVVTNPFTRTTVVPPDGVGLNPLLMDPGMLVHPPMLLLGYMSFSMPFAFAIAALITGRLNAEWLRSIRRWTLASWSLQTMGLMLGAWWAYHVLGWGGYWSWDPVENVALMPWLTATAFLHSTMVQERRGMLKIWSLFLVIASFALSIFGTFEARSGLINSVHSFAYSNIAVYYLVFLIIVVLFSSGLFLFRLNNLQSEQEFDSVVSREGVFLLNNLLLVGITFATLWGTLFPLISQAFRGQTIEVDAPFYNSVNGPLLVLLVLAMGVGPLLAWRRTSTQALWRNLCVPVIAAAVCAAILPLCGVTNIAANVGFSVCAFTAAGIFYELWRGVRVRHSHGEPLPVALFMLFNRYRRRYGGYIVHLGMVLLTIGIIGSNYFQQQTDATLKPGQEMSVAGYRFVYQGNIDLKDSDHETITAQVQIWHDKQLQRYAYPGRIVYNNYPQQPTSAIEIIPFGLTDVYIFLADWRGAAQATIRVFVNPLVPLIWYGGILMFLGGIFCWWPERRVQKVARSVVARKQPVAELEPQTPGIADGGVGGLTL
jgi:cytochrome c-type biogenesis protein CcmF